MATIALYKGTINQMPGLIKSAKKAVSGLDTQLDTLKRKCQKVNAAVCNIDDVISTISASTQTQEEKIEALETFGENVEQFARDTVDIDENVAELVNKNKDDFYDKYSYLKPESEKTFFEHAAEFLQKTAEWCKKHWKLIATVALVALAILAITLVSGGILTGAIAAVLLKGAIGLLVGTIVGAIAGGLIGAFTRKGDKGFWEAFLEGAEDGAFDGTISGMIAGLLTGMGVLSTLKTAGPMIISAIADGISNLIGNLGDMAAGLEDMSFWEVIANLVFSMALGAAGEGLSGILDDIVKINIKGINLNIGKGSWLNEWKLQLYDLEFKGISIDIDDILRGISVDFLDGISSHVVEPGKKLLEKLNEYIGKLRKDQQVLKVPAAG